MSRDQRVRDNWALIFAQNLAIQHSRRFEVVFCLAPEFLGAALRQYAFMLKGLVEVEKSLQKYGIAFHILTGNPEKKLPELLKKRQASFLINDFDPLRVKRKWAESVSKKIRIPFYEIDTHNIVPCRHVTNKLEYGAYTIRPKINRMLPDFSTTFPRLKKQPPPARADISKNNPQTLLNLLDIDKAPGEVNWIKPGEHAARRALRKFINQRLRRYHLDRNDPNKDAQSNLSPYLHFGQLAAQRVAIEVRKADAPEEAKSAFLEELIVRRELSDNFCLHNENYDNFDGLTGWAKKTLDEHRKDKREYIYSLDDFENARTHDRLWNAAQTEMVATGKMHGYMRMYWAKKILEWTRSPESAMKTAIYLNDKYELDGRDPNGYAGIAWSIGGTHDRAWGRQKVFGKIRYMSYNGAKSKFDIDAYIGKIENLLKQY